MIKFTQLINSENVNKTKNVYEFNYPMCIYGCMQLYGINAAKQLDIIIITYIYREKICLSHHIHINCW